MRIYVLSLSPIPVDPRVDKICRTLVEQGHEIMAIGYDSAQSIQKTQLPYKLIPLMPVSKHKPLIQKMAIALRQFPANLIPAVAHLTYTWDERIKAMQRLALEAMSHAAPDLIIANDLATLPLAISLKRKTGARVIYDTHEFAVGEGADRWLWRLMFQVYRKTLEARNISQADAVMTVSPGIAAMLQTMYNLVRMPTVVRNIPVDSQMRSASGHEGIRILYHGLFLKDRGLEALIESVPLLRKGVTLTLRGYGAPDYEQVLRTMAEHHAPDRIIFAPPVPPTRLVAMAVEADIGILPFPVEGAQKEFCLPNKLFEYIHAGLMVVSTPCHDVSAIIHEYALGKITQNTTPKALADVINEVTPQVLAHYKNNASQAAKILTWEQEKNVLLDLVDKCQNNQLV